jgi:TIR domain
LTGKIADLHYSRYDDKALPMDIFWLFFSFFVGGVAGWFALAPGPHYPMRSPMWLRLSSMLLGIAAAAGGYSISAFFGFNPIAAMIVGSVAAVGVTLLVPARREQREQMKALVPDQLADEVSSASRLVRDSAPRGEPSTSRPVRENVTKGEVSSASQPVRKRAPTKKNEPSVRAKAVRIFINYRREDLGLAGRINDRLEEEFGHDQIFMDVDTIPLGVNYVTALNEEVAKCDVLIALIGRDWFDARDEAGHRRLDKPDDFVRIEIAAALKRRIRVIPILIDGTKVPKIDQLPPDIQELALRQGLEVRHAFFKADIERLVRELNA